MHPFLARVRERKLFQWSTAYLAGAWLLLQILHFLSDAYTWPPLVLRLAPLLLGVGLLAALVLAWFHGEKGQQRISGTELLLLMLALLVGGGASWFLIQSSRLLPVHATELTAPSTQADAPFPDQYSLAVLRFENHGETNEQQYFSDGLTEELINVLAQVKGLRVAASTSSFAVSTALSVSEIGARLGVAHLLTGSVRQSGGRLRIYARLIRADRSSVLWSRRYDAELRDLFVIQDEIARSIVDALRIELTRRAGTKLAERGTDDLEAYALYLRGRFYWRRFTEPDLHRSLELFEQAAIQDPSFGRAYVGIGEAWMYLADDWLPPHDAYPKARAAALRALELTPDLAEGHRLLADVRHGYEWDFSGAEQAVRRALALNSNDAEAHSTLGFLLALRSQGEAAAAALERAALLDPLSPGSAEWNARVYLGMGRHDLAVTHARRALEIDSTYSLGYRFLGDALLSQGKVEAALATYRRGLAFDTGFVRLRAAAARALALRGQTDAAREIASRLESEASHRYVRAEEIATIHAALGDHDRAVAWLERAYSERSAGLGWLTMLPMYEPLRADPRFRLLVERVGLP